MASVNLNQLGQAIQLAQMGIALVRSLVAAARAAGQDVPDDAELIRILSDNSAAGRAEAEAVAANLSGQ